MSLLERLLFPAGRAFVPLPTRRAVLATLARQQGGARMADRVVRSPSNPSLPPRAWSVHDGRLWQALQEELRGGARDADSWLEANGPFDSPAETAFVTDVLEPALGTPALALLRAQVPFLSTSTLSDGVQQDSVRGR